MEDFDKLTWFPQCFLLVERSFENIVFVNFVLPFGQSEVVFGSKNICKNEGALCCLSLKISCVKFKKTKKNNSKARFPVFF